MSIDVGRDQPVSRIRNASSLGEKSSLSIAEKAVDLLPPGAEIQIAPQ
jgi:hypothetical protein